MRTKRKTRRRSNEGAPYGAPSAILKIDSSLRLSKGEGASLGQACKGKTVSYYVYMLRCSDRSYYVGQTSDPEGRLYQHRDGLVKGYTHGRRPVKLVWCQEFGTRFEAMDAEKQVKGWSRAKKEALTREDWEAVSQLATRGSHASSSRLALAGLVKDSAPPSRASGRVDSSADIGQDAIQTRSAEKALT